MDSGLRFGDLTPGSFAQQTSDCRHWLDMYTSLLAQIEDVRMRLTDSDKKLSKGNTRVHQGMRASYGSKSPEYVRAQKARIHRRSHRAAVSPAPQVMQA